MAEPLAAHFHVARVANVKRASFYDTARLVGKRDAKVTWFISSERNILA
jgi:hypothetical protein